MNDYKPTIGEVLREVGGGIKDTFSIKTLKSVKNFFVEYIPPFANWARDTAVAPYAIPRVIRLIHGLQKERNTHDYKWTSQDKAEFTGFLTGIALIFGHVAGYTVAVDHNHPEVLLVPATTNILSSVYELGRVLYTRAERRVREKHNGLERIVE